MTYFLGHPAWKEWQAKSTTLVVRRTVWRILRTQRCCL